jgi:hypothetical protein
LEILERINKGEKTELVDPIEGDKPLVWSFKMGLNITRI